jgi:small subunit ribosomal protein S4e
MPDRKTWKRSVAPSFYPIHRKEFKWTIKPSPGPHPADRSLPLAVILREALGLARNLREVRYILGHGEVRVDGKIIRDHRFPVGLMDVLEISPTKTYYRMLPTKKMAVYPKPIQEGEKNVKLCRIEGKETISGGKIQLRLHDGRSILKEDAGAAADLKPGGSLLLNLEERAVVNYVPFKEGVTALVIGGKRQGALAVIRGIKHLKKLGPKIVSLELSDGVHVETVKDYVFPVGVEAPLIPIGGE